MLTWKLDTSVPTAAVLRLDGQLDFASAVTVRTALHKALAEQPNAIVVDLSDLVVLDDITLTVFTAFTRAAAEWPGCPVLLTASEPTVRASLERMGISRLTPVYPDETEALAAAHAIPVPYRYRR
jgi:anti-anti-sigma factor